MTFFRSYSLLLLVPLLCTSTLTLSASATPLATNPTSTATVIGTWQTIDHQTNQPSSWIKISQSKNEVVGTVVKIFEENGHTVKDICFRCKGERHNKRILGMQIMWGMQCTNHNQQCASGRVLDPQTGSIYHAKMSVHPDNKQLDLRGYIGIPLLGKTDTWYRVEGK